MKRIYIYITMVVCCLLATSCEVDNFNAPDATIQGTLFDHTGQPLQVNHGSAYIRMREISWAKGNQSVAIDNQTLKVQQDGTYRNTKWFAGEYRMLPYSGNFFPYDAGPVYGTADAGELVNISGTVTKDFTVTPYLTIEWVKKPTVTVDKFIECTVRFKRNQKAGFEMPNLRDGWLRVSRTVNATAFDPDLFAAATAINNTMEGQEITFRTSKALKYTGIDYWVRVVMGLSAGPNSNYPGVGTEQNCSTIEKISVP